MKLNYILLRMITYAPRIRRIDEVNALLAFYATNKLKHKNHQERKMRALLSRINELHLIQIPFRHDLFRLNSEI